MRPPLAWMKRVRSAPMPTRRSQRSNSVTVRNSRAFLLASMVRSARKGTECVAGAWNFQRTGAPLSIRHDDELGALAPFALDAAPEVGVREEHRGKGDRQDDHEEPRKPREPPQRAS